jgi:hypothetical protein
MKIVLLQLKEMFKIFNKKQEYDKNSVNHPHQLLLRLML